MSYPTTCWFCGNLHAGILVVGNGSALISQRLRSRQTNGVDVMALRELDLWLPRRENHFRMRAEVWRILLLALDGWRNVLSRWFEWIPPSWTQPNPSKEAKVGWVGFCCCQDPGSGCNWRVRLKPTQPLGRYPTLCDSTKTTALFENPGQ